MVEITRAKHVVAAAVALGIAFGSWVSVSSSPAMAQAASNPAPDFELDAPDLVRAALVQQLVPLQLDLRGQFPDTFGGLWIDDDGSVHVAAVGATSEFRAIVQKAEITGVVLIEEVEFSEAELDAAMTRIDQNLDRLAGGGVLLGSLRTGWIEQSLQRNRVIVKYASGEPNDIRDLVGVLGPAVAFEQGSQRILATCSSRTNCGSPLKARLQLYNGTGATDCMSAFVMKDIVMPPHYFLTSAGHCWSGNTDRRHPSTVFIGSAAGQYHPVTTPVDAMRFPISTANASNQLYVTNTLIRPVTQAETTSSEVVGEQVCSSRASGVNCGYLQSKNVCTEYGVCGQRYASLLYVCPGDSGSPVYVVIGSGPSARAIGIVAAGVTGSNPCPNGQTGGSTGIYTHIQLAGGAMNVIPVLTAP